MLAEIESRSDEELAADQYEHLEATVRRALDDDEERTLDVLARCGLAAGPVNRERGRHDHAAALITRR